MLDRHEKTFIWNLINLRLESSIDALDEISDKSNIIKYSIVNRIDNHLKYFIDKNNIQYKFSKKLLTQLNSAVSFKNYRSILFYEEILKISSALTKNNLDHVFLKGSANISPDEDYLIPMRDIDILVSTKDIESAIELVSDIGFYRPNESKYIFNQLPKDPSTYNLPLLKNDKDLFLEIHYKIIAEDNCVPCNFSESLLQDKLKRNVLGEYIYVPCNEDMLLHYLYHGISKGNFDVGPSAVLTINKLSDTRKFSEKKLLEKSKKANLNFEYKIFKALQDYDNKDDETKRNLLDIFLMPTVNKKISSLQLKDKFIDKLKFIFNIIFVEKELIMREFNIVNFLTIHYFLYIVRWFRQINLLFKIIMNIIKNRKSIANRSLIISNLKKKFN